jgi:hypothetical protein
MTQAHFSSPVTFGTGLVYLKALALMAITGLCCTTTGAGKDFKRFELFHLFGKTGDRQSHDRNS